MRYLTMVAVYLCLVLSGCAMYMPSSGNLILDGLLDSSSGIAAEADIKVVLPSKDGIYLVQINQMHGREDPDDLKIVQGVIRVQEQILKILTNIKIVHPDGKICPEGAPSVHEVTNLWRDEVQKLRNFKNTIQPFAQSSVETLIKKLQEQRKSRQEADEFLDRLGLYEAKVVYDSVGPSHPLRTEWLELNIFEGDVMIYGGAIRHLFISGTLHERDLFVCEDEVALLEAFRALSFPVFWDSNDINGQERAKETHAKRFERLQQQRDDFIVYNVVKSFTDGTQVSRVTYVVLGAKHDLTEIIQRRNSKSKWELGYVTIVPHSLKETLEH